MEPEQSERFLTERWNNRLSVGLGVLALAYVGTALLTEVMSDGAAFFWLVLIGVVY